MKRDKENAIYDFENMTKKSWSYERLTEEEKQEWKKTVDFIIFHSYGKGTYRTRWDLMQIAYMAFLNGCGYDGMNWREPNREEVPQF
jgi:hypothetical protein